MKNWSGSDHSIYFSTTGRSTGTGTSKLIFLAEYVSANPVSTIIVQYSCAAYFNAVVSLPCMSFNPLHGNLAPELIHGGGPAIWQALGPCCI